MWEKFNKKYILPLVTEIDVKITYLNSFKILKYTDHL